MAMARKSTTCRTAPPSCEAPSCATRLSVPPFPFRSLATTPPKSHVSSPGTWDWPPLLPLSAARRKSRRWAAVVLHVQKGLRPFTVSDGAAAVSASPAPLMQFQGGPGAAGGTAAEVAGTPSLQVPLQLATARASQLCGSCCACAEPLAGLVRFPASKDRFDLGAGDNNCKSPTLEWGSVGGMSGQEACMAMISGSPPSSCGSGNGKPEMSTVSTGDLMSPAKSCGTPPGLVAVEACEAGTSSAAASRALSRRRASSDSDTAAVLAFGVNFSSVSAF
mmetsp:Transcript_85420/g.183092  ORF Transcript_85420/g.183092 Transcript_85420/m.183092 type:complete len:277 (-) Transcript_85420:121-951(-)